MGAPSRSAELEVDNPYAALIVAILHRAWQDAQGSCDARGHYTTAQLQAEAVAWLQEERTVAELLALAGYDSGPVLRRLRQGLSSHPGAGVP
jgi:hypothetical protein